VRLVWIDVDKSASHHQSRNEIASDNPCYRHLDTPATRLAFPQNLPALTIDIGLDPIDFHEFRPNSPKDLLKIQRKK
jgi:hypothetical protein